MPAQLAFCANYFAYNRLKSRELSIGTLVLGNHHPIAVQSMTNTDTLNTEATVEQCIRIIEAGGELVRITAQGIPEAENLKNIKAGLHARGYNTPLAADIHFNPKAALIAAQYVEKLRINPGNYAERNTKSSYSENEYQQALNKTSEKLQDLISVCKKHKTSIRIGVNHGSLSNRILSRYGNTAEGMVESALEFVRLFEEAEFYDLIISLKSSHVLTMVHANRLLAARMLQNKVVYPIHLGVTEAGSGMEGRQKSIAGIASLLNDGIGDTLRVSLTEAPEHEIPLALALRASFNQKIKPADSKILKPWFDPFSYNKRYSVSVKNIGGKNPAVVIINQQDKGQLQNQIQKSISPSADFIYIGTEKPLFLTSDRHCIQDFGVWKNEHPNCHPLLNKNGFIDNELASNQLAFVELSSEDLNSSELLLALKRASNFVLILGATTQQPIAEWRKAFYILHQQKIDLPVILKRDLDRYQNEALLLEATGVFSSLLIDGLGDGIWIHHSAAVQMETLEQLSFGILQACRIRLTQTEYIACPSCGRTLFNIEERLEEIRNRTRHLKHLKIAIMGCIVNGLGEMADADYGYVGSARGKVNLYKGKILMQKNLAQENASKALIDLIKSEGDWLEK